ncbi:MAG: DUF1932 domain-containing protein [Desulfobacterales bacterium]|nr:DUF1932 domain-containing protein [Desulfobacterales bacterium]
MNFKHIGILSIGEMGFHWARLLRRHDVDVVSRTRDRSAVTQKRAENAGVRVVDSAGQLVAECDLIVSLVVPSAAVAVAQTVAAAVAATGRKDLFFLDANAISPMTAAAVHDALHPLGVTCVDGCIIGSASRLAQNAVVYASGEQADAVRQLSAFGFSVKILGPQFGQASSFKILYAGLTKGLQSLLAELLTGARHVGLLDALMERYDQSFPGLVEKVGGSIAALPVHAARRSEEMAELAQTFAHFGLKSEMAPAAERVLKQIAALKAGRIDETGRRQSDLAGTLALFVQKGLFRA